MQRFQHLLRSSSIAAKNQICSIWVTVCQLHLTFFGILDGYVEDYQREHKDKQPSKLLYIKFMFLTWLFMCQQAIQVIQHLIQEHVRDKRLVDAVVRVSNKLIDISYEYRHTMYTIRADVSTFYNKRFVKANTIDKDGQDVDVSDKVRAYLGPLEDWHKRMYTCKDLGFNSLVIFKMDTDTCESISVKFEADDILVF